MACYSPNVCSDPYPEIFCAHPKPANSVQIYPSRCNASDFTKLKKDLTMNKYAMKHSYPTTYRSYDFKINLQWGKYVNDTNCKNQCNCVYLY